MQQILYRDNPYVILWYNVNLQAYRTDTWTGYHLVPADDGSPFWNMLRTTYIDLQPGEAEEESAGGLPAWAYVALILAIIGLLSTVWLSKRGKKVEEHS
jgi:hypothetical protein